MELITSNLDSIHSTDVHPSAGSATSGLIEGVNTAEAVIRHFRNTLGYIEARKEGRGHEGLGGGGGGLGGEATAAGGGVGAEEAQRLFEDVEVAGPLLKLGSV